MKTIDHKTIAADPVIVEVRHAKTVLAEKYDFDVIAMVESLRNMDAEEKISRNLASPSDNTIVRVDKQP